MKKNKTVCTHYCSGTYKVFKSLQLATFVSNNPFGKGSIGDWVSAE